MKKRMGFLSVSMILALMLTFSTAAQSQGPSDSNPAAAPEVVVPEMYQPSPAQAAAAAASGDALVYFTPIDENTCVTCLFLYNTEATLATVNLRTYRLDGVLYLNTNINVPAGGLVRICSDTVSSVSSTWQSVVLVNFTTNSTLCQRELA